MQLSPAVIEALSIGNLPDIEWKMWDDNCECTFQRIGMWTNPYLAETLEVRMCCIWGEIYKSFPDFVRTVPAFYDYNADQWVTEPATWNGEDDMPAALWHRQLARATGITVSEAREVAPDPPKGKPLAAKPTLFLPWSGEYVAVVLG